MKIYLHLAEGFEDIEAIATTDILRRAGFDVKLVSIMDSKEVLGAWGTKVVADLSFDEVDYNAGDAIVLPGGGLGSENLQKHKGLLEKIKEYNAKKKWVCAICAAPMVLGEAGVLEGKKATCYPGCEEGLKGANVVSDRVCVDGNIITGKGPGATFEFALKIVENLSDINNVNKLKEEMFIK